MNQINNLRQNMVCRSCIQLSFLREKRRLDTRECGKPSLWPHKLLQVRDETYTKFLLVSKEAVKGDSFLTL